MSNALKEVKIVLKLKCSSRNIWDSEDLIPVQYPPQTMKVEKMETELK